MNFVYWLYNGERNYYKTEHVNAQLKMLERFAEEDFKVVCITDTPEGLDSKIVVVEPPIKNDGVIESTNNLLPRCYRRLWNWSAQATVLGERICSMDLDTVIVGPWKKLVSRTEPCVMWRGRGGLLMGGAYLLNTGTHTHIWDQFDFEQSPLILRQNKFQESDQGWLNYTMQENTPVWALSDGILHPPLKMKTLPENVSVVSFGGKYKPWHAESREHYPWLNDYYPDL